MELQNKKRFDAVVIVEGRDDTKRLKQYFPGKLMALKYRNKL